MTEAEKIQAIVVVAAAAAAIGLAVFAAWRTNQLTAMHRDYLAEAFTRLPPPVPRSVFDPAEQL